MIARINIQPKTSGAALRLASRMAGAMLLSIIAASSAQAVSYTQNVSFPSTGLHIDDPYFTFNAPGFNPSLGTLTGFSFAFRSTLSSIVMIGAANQQPVSGTFTNNVIVLGDVAGPNNLIALGSVAGEQVSATELREVIPVTFLATLSPSFLATIVPGTPIDINLTLGVSLKVAPPNSLGASSERDELTGITIQETFVYTPVPEPLSLLLLTTGLIGVAVTRHRQSS